MDAIRLHPWDTPRTPSPLSRTYATSTRHVVNCTQNGAGGALSERSTSYPLTAMTPILTTRWDGHGPPISPLGLNRQLQLQNFLAKRAGTGMPLPSEQAKPDNSALVRRQYRTHPTRSGQMERESSGAAGPAYLHLSAGTYTGESLVHCTPDNWTLPPNCARATGLPGGDRNVREPQKSPGAQMSNLDYKFFGEK